MYPTPTDRIFVEQALTSLQVHPGEIDRLASLGDMPETIGALLVMAIQTRAIDNWLVPDAVPGFLVTDCIQTPPIDMERAIAAGIGLAATPSLYDRLFIGGTAIDAPSDADVIHINVLPEDMRFTAWGPRILTDGMTVPVPDDFFIQTEGYHIPWFPMYTVPLIRDVYRTLKPQGVLLYAASTNRDEVVRLLGSEGFVNIQILGFAPRTQYHGRTTPACRVISANKP